MIYRERDTSLKAYLQQVGLKQLGYDPGPLDNWFGARSTAAYQRFLLDQQAFRPAIASVFADTKDLQNFAKCKAEGHTDLYCFRSGDNGIGASGRITAQGVNPMVALHPLDIRAKWGEMSKAWGKEVVVQYQDKTVMATLEDYMSSPHADIDLNPAAVRQLGIPAGGMVAASWRWV